MRQYDIGDVLVINSVRYEIVDYDFENDAYCLIGVQSSIHTESKLVHYKDMPLSDCLFYEMRNEEI